MSEQSPGQIAGIWAALDHLARRIGDNETRAQALAVWRTRYEEAFPHWLAEGDIVTLPDWEHVAAITPRERRQAARVSEDWVERQRPEPMEFDQVRRFCFEMGRRAAAGFLDRRDAEQICVDLLGTAYTAQGALKAFRRGFRTEEGEALVAAIVLDLRCALLERNEAGLAERFRLRHGHNYRHTTAKGWLRWDGKRWRVLDEERGAVPAELLAAAFDTVNAIQREAAAIRATGLAQASIPEGLDVETKVETAAGKVKLEEIDTRADGLDSLVVMASGCRLNSVALGRWGHASGELKRYKAMVDIARRWLTVSVLEFDSDPFTINCQNGTLRLKKYEERDESGVRRIRTEALLEPHRRGDLLTRVAAVPYDPDATCPNYDFTVEWAQPKPEMRRYIHQWGGYNLTGDMGEQVFHMWWGPLAQNGKSTILDAWADAAGDYAAAGKIETFMEAASSRSGDAATPALAALPGTRMLRTGEPPAGAKFDESLINTITGQDPLLIRALHRSFYEVKLQIKVTVACNETPGIPKGTEGIKRRVKVVLFEKTMKDAKKPDGTPLRDPNFKAKLVPELPGIFAQLVRGALDWLEHGLIEPEDVTKATDEYKDDNDPLGRFLDYCVVFDSGSRVQSSRLFELFVAWGKAAGGPDWSQKYFTTKMKAKGYSNKASNGMQWLGLRTVREVGDFVDEHGKVIDLSQISHTTPDPGDGASPHAPPSAWPDDDDPFGDPSAPEW